VLRAFRDACRHRRGEVPQGVALGGILAAIGAAAIGGMPLFGSGMGRTGNYEAYYFKRDQMDPKL
jgi:hypothetical protein